MAGDLGGSWWNPIDNIIAQAGNLAGKNAGADATTSKQGGNYVAGIDSGSTGVLGATTDPGYGYYDANSGGMVTSDGLNASGNPIFDANGNRINYGASTGQTAARAQAAKQKAEYQRQIDAINGILGVYSAQRGSGISGIDNQYNEKKARLGEQRSSAMTGYDDQNNLALQGRTRGYEQVDKYANDSANSLSRIFQGANAGNSSVARLLAPSLVGKAADSRRLDVTTTANQNLGGIKKARDEANTEFDYSNQDLENNRGYAKDAFEKNLTQQEIDQYNSRLSAEQGLGADTSGTQNEINSRTARLSQLFGAGSFNPQYQVRAVAPKAVQLADYQVDPVKVQAGQQQSGGGFYAQQLKKKNELRVR